MRARSIAVLVCAVGCLTVYALVNFLPAFPKSAAGWLALLFLGVPLLIGTEFLGDRVLGSRTLAQRSSVARVTIALITFIFFLVVLIPLFAVVSRLIDS
jgi:hypothetical protein